MMYKNNKKIRTVKKQLTTKQNIREKQKFVLFKGTVAWDGFLS